MKGDLCAVISSVPLVNQFSHVTLETPIGKDALPGHYVMLNKKPAYIMGQSATTLELLLPEFSTKTVSVSALQGTPLDKPSENFNLLTFTNETLSAGIFYLKKYRTLFKGLLFIGMDADFPFKPCPSRKLIPGIPPDVIAALPLFEDWGIAHRLASLKEQPGVFHGTAKDLAKLWLAHNYFRR